MAAAYNRPVHFCHISRREEIELIAQAKAAGLPITCEVTPHHLFLTQANAARLGPLGDMRPKLGTPSDVAALWEHLHETIDCIATDHAPHTLAEKQSATPPPGVIGLETSLPLMMTAVLQNHLTLERLIELMSTNPRRIYNLPTQPNTAVTVQLTPNKISNKMIHSKCGWTPFDGTAVAAKVQQVVLRGKVVFENGRVLAKSGAGKLLS